MILKKSRKLKLRKGQPKGITLVEVLITVTIVSFMILAMLSLYLAGQRYYMNGTARSDVLRDNLSCRAAILYEWDRQV
jgi:Tfp pilus assembly protein PilV